MERWVLVSFFVVCFLCLVQAFPQASTEPQPTAPGQIESAVNDVIQSLQKSLKGIMEDPSVNKLLQDGQRAISNAVDTIRTETAKIVPKTD